MEVGVSVHKPHQRTHSSFCAAINCSNTRAKRRDLSFFRFPNDVDRAKIWAINVRRADLVHRAPEYLHRNCSVCSEHFETIMFLNDLRNRLHSHAIPKIINVSNPLPCQRQAAVGCQPSRKRKQVLEIMTENGELDVPVDTAGPIVPSLDTTYQHGPSSSTSNSNKAYKLVQILPSPVLQPNHCTSPVTVKLEDELVDTAEPMVTSLDTANQHRPVSLTSNSNKANVQTAGSSTSNANVAYKLVQILPCPVLQPNHCTSPVNVKLEDELVDTAEPMVTSLDTANQHRPGSSASTSDVAHELVQGVPCPMSEHNYCTSRENGQLEERLVHTAEPIVTLDTTNKQIPASSSASISTVAHKLVQSFPCPAPEHNYSTSQENGKLEGLVHTAGPILTSLDTANVQTAGSSTSNANVAHKLVQIFPWPVLQPNHCIVFPSPINGKLEQMLVHTAGPSVTTLDTTNQHRPGSSASISTVAHKSVQTPKVLSSRSPRTILLKKKIHSLRVVVCRQRKRLELVKKELSLLKKQHCSRNVATDSIQSIIKAASGFLNAECLSWLEIQLRMAKHGPKGRRYSDTAKRFAMNLYSHGPKAYRFLSNIFALPSMSTLSPLKKLEKSENV